MSTTTTATLTATTPKAKASNARVSLSPCTLNNLGTVRKLNSVLFPIRYAERFYKDILLPEAEPYCQICAPLYWLCVMASD